MHWSTVPLPRAHVRPADVTSLVLLQIAAILVVCQVLSLLFRRLNQPAVVCQMLAGVLIGPSLLGLWPEWRQVVFPAASAGVISAISQVGLVLFMFCAGAELDLGLLRRKARAAATISIVSVGAPLAAGALVASQLVTNARLFPQNVSPAVEIAFLGIAIAITAFPVMARIITESGLTNTAAGATSLAAGCFTDAVAWCLLALLLTALSGTPARAGLTLGAAVVLVAFAVVARTGPVARLLERGLVQWVVAPWLPPFVLIGLLAVSWLSDVAGLHPAFGAFVFGLAMPRGELIEAVRQRVEPVAVNVLLPLYFVSTGLSTSVGLLTAPGLLQIGLILLATAILSKGVTCWLVARLTRHSSRDALLIGALMNARGLVELVILGIGLQRHVITPALFSIMVIVAIVTTMLAGPVIALAYPEAARWRTARPCRAREPAGGPDSGAPVGTAAGRPLRTET
jgi:Kef-type K+ transport system membrane component KefB